jgi:hypothetical protein
MSFKRFLQWCATSLAEFKMFPALGGGSSFEARYEPDEGLVLRLTTGYQEYLNDQHLKKIFARWVKAPHPDKYSNSYYSYPEWRDMPNLTLTPAVPALIKVYWYGFRQVPLVGAGEATADFLPAAERLIEEGEIRAARELLEQLIQAMPKGWKPTTERADHISVAFWDYSEFRRYALTHRTDLLTWERPSYSKAYYLLTWMAVEAQDWSNALSYVDAGLALDPDHPALLCEKGNIVAAFRHYDQAYELFMKAANVRPWAAPEHRAQALRCAAVALVDIGKYDEAGETLKKSLEIEPNNEIALQELNCIKYLKKAEDRAYAKRLYSYQKNS